MLRSADTNLVLHAAAALHHLSIAQDTLARLQRLPEGAFRELLGGLVELMAMNTMEDNSVAHDDASAALTALLGCPELLARVCARYATSGVVLCAFVSANLLCKEELSPLPPGRTIGGSVSA